MVILIGGSSCTGKTLLASQLMEKHNIPYFSIDYLKMGIFRSDNHCGFTPVDDINVIAEKLWPIIREMIKTYIENKQDIIIEGAYILPQYLEDFEGDYKKEITSVFLGFSESYINENYHTGIIGCRNVIEQRFYNENRLVEQFIKEHRELKRLCNESDAEYYEIVSDYKEEMDILKARLISR